MKAFIYLGEGIPPRPGTCAACRRAIPVNSFAYQKPTHLALLWFCSEACLASIEGAKPDMAAAHAAAEEGIKQAADHANREHSGWTSTALASIQAALCWFTPDQEFTFEEVRLRAEGSIPAPPDGRAWGQVTVMAKKAGCIIPTGHSRAAASSNGSPKPCYRRGT